MALDTPGGSSLSSRLSNFFGRTGNAHVDRMLRKSRIASNIYLPVFIPTVLLVIYGLIVIWSASLYIEEASFPRQLFGVILGFACAIFVWRYDVRSLANLSTALLIADIVLMLLPSVPGLGYSAKGMTGWVRIPLIGLRFQPSEIAKIVTIFLMAAETAQFNGKIPTLRDYVKLCGTLLVPFVLILVQPDLGTGLVILFTGACIIIVGGAKRSWVLVTIAIMIFGIAVIIITSSIDGLPHILKEYQLKRLAVFIDPSVDPTGDGYNLQQAKIAVGSGGLFGKGIGNATQAGQGFLPEAHTDFVFALLSEEFGFFGAVVLLGLFAWLIFATLALAIRTESPFVKLVLVGIVAMWTFQVLENVGMCIGLMPITGIPLPFISYGSSSMVTQLTATGVIQSLWRHRKKSA
jgi:rod shape determining protein RodA